MTRRDEFLAVKQAADFLGVSPNTIRNWDRDGKIPGYRHPLNDYRLFKRQDLEAILKKIERSGHYPSGWAKPNSRRKKPK